MTTRTPVPVLLRALALGAASGARSSAGLAAVALTSVRGDRGAVASRLGGRAGTTISIVMAAAELVVDKLPTTPSRLVPPALVLRLVTGAVAAGAVARRDGRAVVLPALFGMAGAGAAAVLGVRCRAAASHRFGSDVPAALIEDAATALLAWWGATPAVHR